MTCHIHMNVFAYVCMHACMYMYEFGRQGVICGDASALPCYSIVTFVPLGILPSQSLLTSLGCSHTNKLPTYIYACANVPLHSMHTKRKSSLSSMCPFVYIQTHTHTHIHIPRNHTCKRRGSSGSAHSVRWQRAKLRGDVQVRGNQCPVAVTGNVNQVSNVLVGVCLCL